MLGNKTLAGDSRDEWSKCFIYGEGSFLINCISKLEGKLGRGYIVSNSKSIESGVKKKTLRREIVIGPNAIKFVTVIIVAILAVVYLSQSTAGASRSVKIRDIEGRKGDLLLQKERLQAEQTRLKSLKEIDNGTEKQVLEPVSSVDHLGGAKTQVALHN